MAIFKYTTKVSPEQSIAEITAFLIPRGATGILSEYGKDQKLTSVSFKMDIRGQTVAFRLPCKWEPILRLLEEDSKVERRYKTEEQAHRVAWRIVHAWVEAQMALIDTMMVDMPTVFLPYMITKDGRLLSERVIDDPKFLLN